MSHSKLTSKAAKDICVAMISCGEVPGSKILCQRELKKLIENFGFSLDYFGNIILRI